ncbi:MAG: hypothetical protein RLZZ519_558 [Bacteroidota bacterium]|jgi:hypothetical protein
MDVPKIIKLLDRVFSMLPQPVSKCISVHSEIQLHLFDPQGGKESSVTVILNPTASQRDKVFSLRNPNQTEVAVWAFDGCTDLRLFEGDLVAKRCDAIAFNEREIVFVELKLEASSTNPRTLNETRKKATDQLFDSIYRVFSGFKEGNTPLPWIVFEAYLATHPNFPRAGVADARLSARFTEIGVELFELNVKVMQ